MVFKQNIYPFKENWLLFRNHVKITKLWGKTSIVIFPFRCYNANETFIIHSNFYHVEKCLSQCFLPLLLFSFLKIYSLTLFCCFLPSLAFKKSDEKTYFSFKTKVRNALLNELEHPNHRSIKSKSKIHLQAIIHVAWEKESQNSYSCHITFYLRHHMAHMWLAFYCSTHYSTYSS
jgi:hypothetical protein